MAALVTWANSDPVMDLHPLYRAPLIHYYLEQIHPFYDGNGRVGRVIEMVILAAAHYSWTSVVQYYLDNYRDYSRLLNTCRISAKRGEENPNTEFVKFHLTGALSGNDSLGIKHLSQADLAALPAE